jgi:hypothetical protein
MLGGMSAVRRNPAWLTFWIGAVFQGCDHSLPTSDHQVLLPSRSAASTPASVAAVSSPATQFKHELRSDDWFEDVTPRTGIRFSHHNGRDAQRYFLIESFGGGAAAVDYDRDGDVDLVFTGGGTISTVSAPPPVVGGLPPALYRNQGDWQFIPVEIAGWFTAPPDYTFGCTSADFDSDGFVDLFLYCYGRGCLYHNLGDGTFHNADPEDVCPVPGMWTAAVWGDADQDGLPDLFLARYADWTPETDVHCYTRQSDRGLCGPSKYSASTAAFLHNRGDGTFDDWTSKIGLRGGVKGLGLLAGDFDVDGKIDFYLANDETANHLYWGTAEGALQENAWLAGVAAGESGLEEGSMGVDAGDVDSDGRIDLWVVNYESEDNALYCGAEDRLFDYATVRMGLAGPSRMRVGWGTALRDFDGDGWLDILVLNGHALYSGHESPYLQSPQLFRNLEGVRFEDVSDRGGSYFRAVHAARGSAVADINDDGAPDFVAVHLNDPVCIMRNRRPPRGYVSLRLRATYTDRDALGARVTLTAGNERPMTRFVVRGSSYASHADDRLLFALGSPVATAEVIVDWPSGTRQIFPGLAVNRTNVLVEARHQPHAAD